MTFNKFLIRCQPGVSHHALSLAAIGKTWRILLDYHYLVNDNLSVLTNNPKARLIYWRPVGLGC